MYTITTRQTRGKGFFFSNERTRRKSSEGEFSCEGNNHLGNVLAVISDKVNLYGSGRKVNDKIVADSVRATVVSASDYYPGGLAMKGRQFNANQYRYGFNSGSEKDDEISGAGNHYTTEWRELDTRLGGRWWSPDRIVKPWESPYAGFANNPIYFSDPSGLDPTKPISNPQPGDKGPNGEIYDKQLGWVLPEVSVTASKLPSIESIAEKGVTVSSTQSLGVGYAATIAGAVDQAYGFHYADYDHIKYRTLAGKLLPILRADGTVRSAQALKAQKLSRTILVKGLGLNLLSTALTATQVYQQGRQGGLSNINVVDAAGLGIGIIGTGASTISLAGYGGVVATSTAYATGLGGLAISTGQLWYFVVYKPFFDMLQFNYPTTNNIDEAMWNQKMDALGVINDNDLFGGH